MNDLIIKVVDIELSQPLQSLTQLTGYSQVKGIVRFRQRPLGWVDLPVSHGTCTRETIAQRIFPYYIERFQQELVQDYLLRSGQKTWELSDLLASPPAASPPDAPLLTVVYSLCDRTHLDFAPTLQAISQLDYPQLEVLIVESLPPDRQVQQYVERHHPTFRYLSTPEWGLNAARNLAIATAQGDFIGFLNGAIRPEPNWAKAIVETFAAQPAIAAITGLTIPYNLAQRSQALVASHYALERGFGQRYYHWPKDPHWSDLGTGQIGSGANFACRRTLFTQVGPFDPALDIPGKTDGGGDFDLFTRALMRGLTLLYEPHIVAHWQPPSEPAAIRRFGQQQIRGFYSACQSGMNRYPQCRRQFLTLATWRFVLILMRLVRPYNIPRSWSFAELQAALGSWGSYTQGLDQVAALPPSPQACELPAITKFMAVRMIDLDSALPDLEDIADYQHLRLFIQDAGQLNAKVDLQHHGQPVSRQRLAQAIAEQRLWALLSRPFEGNETRARAEVEQALQAFWLPPIAVMAPADDAAPPPGTVPIPQHITIIVPTCDRPEDLHGCLKQLQQLQTTRQLEIIVADNRPQSGLAAAVVRQFPCAQYIAEPRVGSSYARNTAIAASHGEVIVMVDDDVVVPTDWLEKLLAPLARPEVMAVTGNVLPYELDTKAQWIFEDLKGGLGAGLTRKEANRQWLDAFPHSPPTWDLGVSANAAFRASLFADPEVGLMEEVLGAGTPCCGGEENHLVYKILRAGHTLIYEPNAYVWHRHRRTMKALQKQYHGYMRSSAGYHFILWQKEQDPRAKQHLTSVMHSGMWGYVCDRLKGKHQVPWSIVWGEFTGYVAGFWGYYQSVQRVKQLGRSAPYIPPSERGKPQVAHALRDRPPTSPLSQPSDRPAHPAKVQL